MRRRCKPCGKFLSAECDYCHSLNVRPSRTTQGTLNCGNCLRRGIPLGNIKFTTCHECERRLRRMSDRHGDLKYEIH